MVKLEMKKCKECGEMFMPTSNKQKYCTKMHYRPCPVCGKPVYAKYLSDPARCCSGICKAKLGKLNKSDPHYADSLSEVVQMQKDADEVAQRSAEHALEAYGKADVADVEEYAKSTTQSDVLDAALDKLEELANSSIAKTYVGPSQDGWIQNNRYAVVITQEGKEHVVSAKYDYTACEDVSLEYRFTNKKKISQIFKAR